MHMLASLIADLPTDNKTRAQVCRLVGSKRYQPYNISRRTGYVKLPDVGCDLPLIYQHCRSPPLAGPGASGSG